MIKVNLARTLDLKIQRQNTSDEILNNGRRYTFLSKRQLLCIWLGLEERLGYSFINSEAFNLMGTICLNSKLPFVFSSIIFYKIRCISNLVVLHIPQVDYELLNSLPVHEYFGVELANIECL